MVWLNGDRAHGKRTEYLQGTLILSVVSGRRKGGEAEPRILV